MPCDIFLYLKLTFMFDNELSILLMFIKAVFDVCLQYMYSYLQSMVASHDHAAVSLMLSMLFIKIKVIKDIRVQYLYTLNVNTFLSKIQIDLSTHKKR